MEKILLCFDFDGTIVDDTYSGFAHVNALLQGAGLESVHADVMREYWGMKTADFWESICLLQGASPTQIRQCQMAMTDLFVPVSCRLEHVLRGLSSRGFLLGLLTSRTKASLKKYTEKTGFDTSIFKYIQTADDYSAHKPSGAVFTPLLRWAHKYELTSDKIVYFGDTVNYDLKAVINANSTYGFSIGFKGICSGINTYEEFLAAGLKNHDIIPEYNFLPFYLNEMAKGGRP